MKIGSRSIQTRNCGTLILSVGLPPRQKVVVQALARYCVRQGTSALCPRKLLKRTMLFSLLGSAREQDLGRPETFPTKRLLGRIGSVAD